MRTAIYCLETAVGLGSAPLAALAQRPGVIAMVWETTGSRLRVRFDETRLDPEMLKSWLCTAGYPVLVYTLLNKEEATPLTSQPSSPHSPSIAWIELDPPVPQH